MSFIFRQPGGRTASDDYRILRLLVSGLSIPWSGVANRRLVVLIFHRVRPHRDPLFPGEPDSSQFARAMEVVANCFNCQPLDEAVQRLSANRPLPDRAVAITLDDGYRDNYSEAFPILRRYGLTATFFVASGYLDGGCMWRDELVESVRSFSGEEIDLRPLGLDIEPCRNDEERIAVIGSVSKMIKFQPLEARREALERLRDITGMVRLPQFMLSSEQVREMHSAGMGIGGHTLRHQILGCIDDRVAWREIGEDRERLGAIIGQAPSLFAYPNGKPHRDYGARHAAMVRAAGYRAAFTTVWGAAGPGTDPFQLPRFSPWDRHPVRFALRLAHNFTRTRFAQV